MPLSCNGVARLACLTFTASQFGARSAGERLKNGGYADCRPPFPPAGWTGCILNRRAKICEHLTKTGLDSLTDKAYLINQQ